MNLYDQFIENNALFKGYFKIMKSLFWRLKFIYKAVFFVVAINTLLSCQFSELFSSSIEVSSSPNDRREYRYLQLPNELQVLLVHDREAQQAAASIDVHVGSRNDPSSRQGLAHFLEHMLFLGTNKYPNAGEYQEFISQHGGSHNAYTSREHTNYFFSIEEEYLDAALDRFADFFVAPLFQEAYVEREINAVESEYRSQIDNPYRQIQEATQQLMSPKNPMSQLSVGNLKTLTSSTLRDELLVFFNKNYSASRMALTVIGNYSLDELEQMVSNRFSGIKNNGSVMQPINMPLFDTLAVDNLRSKVKLPSVLEVQTSKPLRRLILTFPLPDLKEYFRSKPTIYLGDIIGYEGERSVLSVLKQLGFAEALSVGVEPNYTGGSALQVAVNLTEKGLNNIDKIIEAVYVAIGQVLEEQKSFPEKAKKRFEELSQLAGIKFRFYEYPAPMNTAISTSSGLHFYPPDSVISGVYDYSIYNADAITKFGELLRPDNMLITIASNQMPVSFNPTEKTQWYNTPFSVTAVPEEWRRKWIQARNGTSEVFKNSIALPPKNPFIPTDFSIVQSSVKSEVDNNNIPGLFAEKSGMQVWLKVDDTFAVPKADAHLAFFTRHSTDSLKNQVLSGLFAKVVNEQLNEFVYPAYQAGSWLSFFSHVRGFSLKVGGYSDALQPLLAKALQSINNIDVNEQRFNDLRTEQIRQFSSALQATPSRRLNAYLGTQLIDFNSDYLERITMLNQLTLADLNLFAETVWDNAYTLALLHGNIDNATAEKLLALIEQKGYCDCKREEADQISVVELEEGVAVSAIQLPHSDKAVLWYFQSVNDDLNAIAATALTASIAQPIFYNTLRTEQQLGYIVGVSQYNLHRLPGLSFTVQSPDTSEQNIVRSINAFLQKFISEPVSHEIFNSHKSALISQLSKQDSHLHERTNRFWSSIALGESGFNRLEQLEEKVRGLSYEDWKIFVRVTLGNERRSLLLTTAANESQLSETELEITKNVFILDKVKPWSEALGLPRKLYSGG